MTQEGYRKGIITKKKLEFLIPLAPRMPIIYYLPKVHKNQLHLLGQLIVSGIDSVTSHIGKFVDNFLQPLVTKTLAFLNALCKFLRKYQLLL